MTFSKFASPMMVIDIQVRTSPQEQEGSKRIGKFSFAILEPDECIECNRAVKLHVNCVTLFEKGDLPSYAESSALVSRFLQAQALGNCGGMGGAVLQSSQSWRLANLAIVQPFPSPSSTLKFFRKSQSQRFLEAAPISYNLSLFAALKADWLVDKARKSKINPIM
jgi:hypothetical protein